MAQILTGQNGLPLPNNPVRLNLADIVASGDPGARLSAAITDGGEGLGISIPLTGGWSSTDFGGTYPFLTWNLKDPNGTNVGGDVALTVALHISVRTHPGDSTDTDLDFLLLNASDPTTATVDGQGIGFRWSGATRTILCSALTNGASVSTPSTSSSTLTNGVGGYVYKIGAGATARIGRNSGRGVDANGIAQATIESNNQTIIVVGAPANWFLCLMAGRSAATAGNVTVAVDIYYSPVVAASVPT